jgi:hypothetical protein
MTRRARLLRALARHSARLQAADRARGDTPLTGDRWFEARWWLSAHAPHAPGLRYPTRLVRRWRWTWTTRGGRRVRV